ncbi:MAG: exosome complex protein Rrp42 [Candidatus Micrarchaeia archaeon]
MEILNELKRDTIVRALAEGKRFDGRKLDEYRPVRIQKNVIPNAEGSALCQIGKTQVIAGLKFDIATPYADRPDEGVFSTGAEFVPLGSHMFEPGPPSPDAIELARVVDRGIRSSETIDLKSFAISDEKVLALYLDLWVVDYGGNLIDTAALAAMAALLEAKMPKVEDAKIIRSENTGSLKIGEKVVACSFSKFGPHYLLDPALDEDLGMDGKVTISTTSQHVCAVQKSGWASATEQDVSKLVDLAFERGKELRALL